MQTGATTETYGPNVRRAPQRRLDLDALARMRVDALGQLYAGGGVPASLVELDGYPRGRMLAVRRLDRGPLFAALRKLAGGSAFPWEGKSFRAQGPGRGAGANRVNVGGRHALFPFETRIDASVLDGAPAVILDYDLNDNPRLIRAIHDEVRLVDDGLYLGPAMWKGGAGPGPGAVVRAGYPRAGPLHRCALVHGT